MRQNYKNMEENTVFSSTSTVPQVDGLKDIAGMRYLKKLLTSLIVRPRTQPQLFKNRKVSNTILLYGPPGTGKTTLVHATAATADALLHCVSSSDLLSSYVGETEKNIKELFDNLRKSDRSVILFMDELDGFCKKRTDTENDHSRRLKTELMVQLSKIENYPNITFIGATNRPWDLDSAILRRFSRRFYIALPNKDERQELLELFTRDIDIDIKSISAEFFDYILENTEGFSGSDISTLVQHAIEIPILELEDTFIWYQDEGCYKPWNYQNETVPMEFTVFYNINDLPDGSIKARAVTANDFISALNDITRSISTDEINMFEDFEKPQN